MATVISKGTTKTAAAPKAAKPKAAAKPAKVAKPKEPSAASSPAELAAAIEGTLKPRSEKGTSSQSTLKQIGKHKRPSGRPLGTSTGLPISLFWCYIFQQNEKAPKANKLTDDKIRTLIKKEFPGRASNAFDAISTWRHKFNLGGFTRGSAPKLKSKRYDEAGNEFSAASARGRKPGKKGTTAAPAKAA